MKCYGENKVKYRLLNIYHVYKDVFVEIVSTFL